MITPFMQLSLTLNGTSESKGYLHFGLFRGAHSVSQRISSDDDEPYTRDYLICKYVCACVCACIVFVCGGLWRKVQRWHYS